MIASSKVDRVSALKDNGLSNENKTVMVCSTWREHSLIRSHGMKLIEKLKELTVKYNVVLTIHENNFLSKYSGGVNWKVALSDLERNHRVKVLWDRESPFRYLGLADILVADVTSLALYYSFLCRPIILISDLDDKDYMPDSTLFELKRFSYIPTNGVEDLEVNIAHLLKSFEPDVMQSFFNKLSSYPGLAKQKHLEELHKSLNL